MFEAQHDRAGVDCDLPEPSQLGPINLSCRHFKARPEDLTSARDSHRTVVIALDGPSVRLDMTPGKVQMHLPERIRHHFPDATFGEPCSQSDIARAEQALGEQLPAILRELYLSFDGFRMSEGGGLGALQPLFGREGLVEMNAFFRSRPEFPTKLVSQCLFFGNDGIGGYWGFKHDLPGKVIRWDAEWGEDFEIDSDSPLDAWLAERRKYEQLKQLKQLKSP